MTDASMVVGMYVTPLWPAYGAAIARGDVTWARMTLFARLRRRARRLRPAHPAPLGGSARHAAAVGAGGFAVWTVRLSAASAVAAFLNGAGRLRFQVVTAVEMGVAALTLKLVLARGVGFSGSSGQRWPPTRACTVIPMACYIPRLMAGLGHTPPDRASR